MRILTLYFLLIFLLCSCNVNTNQDNTITDEQEETSTATINPTGEKLIHRIAPPSGYTWETAMPNSFAEFLHNLPLKETGSPVLDYTGTHISNQEEHIAIINYDVGTRNFQQCADATIRLRAEYLF